MSRTLPSRAGDRRRALSQNFLVDPRAIERIVQVAAPTGLVLEPGGGAGALTRPLTARASAVWTWELDPHWVEVLRSTTSARVVPGDFTRAREPDRGFQVVGNIPYSSTARILDWCLRARRMRSATLLVQLEVALKRSGGYGRWSRLTALTWPTHAWSFHGRVGRRAFRPVPRVDSGILRLERRSAPLLDLSARRMHARVVEAAFGDSGSDAGRAITRAFGRPTATALDRAGVARSTPVALVHPDSWVEVTRRLLR